MAEDRATGISYAGFWIMLGLFSLGTNFDDVPSYVHCMKVDRIDAAVCRELYTSDSKGEDDDEL